MKNPFKKAAAAAAAFLGTVTPLSEAEKALKAWGIEYKHADGSLLVPENLNISGKGLTSLPDLRKVKVGGDFNCSDNQLVSLEHAPQSVGGNFWCTNNQLTSLEHAPHTVGGFYCYHNPLTSLEGAPLTFKKLHSDFGEFASWQEVPETLRLSPETRVRLEQERLAEAVSRQAAMVHAATVLQTEINVSAPLKLRRILPPLS